MRRESPGESFILDFAESLKRFMLDCGCSVEVADFVSIESAKFVCKEWGGQQPYIPMKLPGATDDVSSRIYDAFYVQKKSLRECAALFNKAERTIRSVLGAESQRRKKAREHAASERNESQIANLTRWKKEELR